MDSIIIKYSQSPGVEPVPNQLLTGEPTMNTYDGRLFMKKSDINGDSIVSFVNFFDLPSATVLSASFSSFSATASFVTPLKQNVFITGSLNISGSTLQVGNNTLLGNTLLSGSVTISGSIPGSDTNINIYGDTSVNGAIKFLPVLENIDNSVSASYIFVSGSTQDLYFSQNGSGYSNITRLRWLESNLYTGLLSGGVMSSTLGSTTFTLSSGSGIIVTLNASTGSSDPFPTVKYVKWNTQTNPITYSGSAKITYVGIDNTGTVVQQTVPFGTADVSQWDQSIELGVVLHLSGSVSTGVYNSPQVSYGLAQRTDDFIRAFGPMKLSGHALQASGSTLGLTKTSGTAYNNGANYIKDPNHPSTISDSAVTVSKIYRYYVSGSTPVIDSGISSAGYTVLDPSKYVDITTGTLGNVPGGSYTIQRVFWIPNSPTNAFLVYYGNARYNSSDTAIAAIQTEQFTESPNTAQNAILLGYVIISGNETNLQNAVIIQGGLFRSVAGIGNSNAASVANALYGLSDVALSSPTRGDLLIYGNGTQWNNGKALSGSYFLTGSLTAINGGFTGSLSGSATNAITASYSISSSQSISSSYSLTSSYALSAANAFVQNGNSFGAVGILGTKDSQNLALITNNSTRLFISSSGAYVGIGANTPSATIPQALLDVNGIIRARSGFQIMGDGLTTVLSSSRSDNTFISTLTFNGWGDYAFDRSLLIGYTPQANPYGTGNLYVSGKIGIAKSSSNAALDVNGNAIVTGSLVVTSGITGSLLGSSSYADTASYIVNAQSASYVLNAVSASRAVTASYSANSLYAATSSYASSFTAANLSLGTSAINVTTGYGNYISSVGYPVTGSVDSSDFWIRLINISSDPLRIRLYIDSGYVDNTIARDEFEIVTSGYGMTNHILRKPTTIYNASKIIGILTSNPTAASQEVWINVAGVAASGTINIYSNVALDSLANMQASKTLTKPTKAGGGTELTINNTKRQKYTIQTSAGAEFNGELNVSSSLSAAGISSTLGFTGSLQGTATNAITASFVTTAQTASYVLQAVSSSFSITASYVANAQTASYILNAVSSSYSATSSYADNFTVGNTLTVQRIVAQTISSSIEYASGSNIFGSLLTNTHQFTGSVSITGSLTTTGVSYIRTSASAAPFMSIGINAGLYPALTAYNSSGVNKSQWINANGSMYFDYDGVGGGNLNFRRQIDQDSNTIARFVGNGNLLLQNAGTYTDNGYKVQINSTGSLSGSLWVSGSSVFSGSVVQSGSLTSYGPNTFVGNTSITGSVGISGSLTVSNYDTTITGSLIIASIANPAQKNTLATDVNGYLSFQSVVYQNGIGSQNGNVNLYTNYIIVSNSTGSGYMFSANANATAGTQDTGIRRNTAGTIEIFNGSGDTSVTNRRDLILRNITGSNASFTGSVTATLGFTGSILGTASTASYVANAQTASYVLNAVSASYAPTATNVFVQGGNSFGTTATIGTNDNQALNLETNNASRIVIYNDGNIRVQPSYISSTRPFMDGMYIETHPESDNPAIIPYLGNDIAYNTLRGGTFTGTPGSGSTTSTSAGNAEALFDGAPTYAYWNSADLSGSYTASIAFPQSYYYGNTIGFSFGQTTWRAQNFKVEILVTGSYYTLDTVTNWQYGSYNKSFNYAEQAVQGAKITFSNFASSGFRIADIFLLNYNSTYGKGIYVGRDGGHIYKGITVTGSVVATSGGFTGSLQGTSTTASYVQTAQTASYVLNAVSSSYAITASYVLGTSPTSSYALSSSNAVSSSYAVTSSYADNFTVGNTLTVQRIVAQTITSSIDFVTGSSRFGNRLDNTHDFTGSVSVTGSLTTTILSVNGKDSYNTLAYITSNVNGFPATSSTSQPNAALRLRGGDNAVLDFGLNSINTWIQATDRTGLGLYYNILLNPRGGNVGIGTGTTSPASSLHVSGAEARFGGVVGAYISLYNATNRSGYIQANSGSDLRIGTDIDPMTFYVSGSERMRINSAGSLGLGVTPSGWTSGKVLQTVGGSLWGLDVNTLGLVQNAFLNGAAYNYISTAAASYYVQASGQHIWYNAPSGTAGTAITFTQAMTLNSSGNLGINTTTPNAKLDVNGNTIVTGSLTVTAGITGSLFGTASYASTSPYSGLQGTVPTWNQNTTGQAGSVANAVTFTNTGGAAVGTTYNGSVARTIDYSTLGAQQSSSNLSSISALSYAIGSFVKMTGANTFSLDTNTYYSSSNPSGYTNNTGTVTSVGGTGTVSGLTLTGTVTTTGNLTLGGTLAVTAGNFASQTANTFLCAPNGSAGTPTFRAIVAADIPTLNQSTTGNAATATSATTSTQINVTDLDRTLASPIPTTYGQLVRFTFANASATGTGGNYAGVMTFSPWSGTTASTGDASYQLAFGSTATNGGGTPQLRIRKGIDSTWNSWYDIITNINYNSYSPTLNGTGSTGNWPISVTGNAATATTAVSSQYVDLLAGRTDSTAYPVLWGVSQGTNATTGNPKTYAFSCSSVTITSSTGTLTASGLTESSSKRYKENIIPLENSLDKIIKLRGVKYNKIGNDFQEIGFIAEEIEEVVPEFVVYNEEGQADSVNYGRMTALLLEGMKEQQLQIEQLKAEIELLKQK